MREPKKSLDSLSVAQDRPRHELRLARQPLKLSEDLAILGGHQVCWRIHTVTPNACSWSLTARWKARGGSCSEQPHFVLGAKSSVDRPDDHSVGERTKGCLVSMRSADRFDKSVRLPRNTRTTRSKRHRVRVLRGNLRCQSFRLPPSARSTGTSPRPWPQTRRRRSRSTRSRSRGRRSPSARGCPRTRRSRRTRHRGGSRRR